MLSLHCLIASDTCKRRGILPLVGERECDTMSPNFDTQASKPVHTSKPCIDLLSFEDRMY